MKYIDVDKFNAEIERLYNGEAPKHDPQCNFDDGYFTGIDTISQLIDSFQQEQPEVDLEKEFRRFIKKEKEGEPDGSLPFYGDYGIYRIARHFYELGKNSK